MITNEFPAGLTYVPNFISLREEKKLISQIQLLNWQNIVLFEKPAKRRVVHFGLNYIYGTRQVEPTTPPPIFLHELIQQCADYLHLPFSGLAEVLITEYLIGAGIGWHRDAPVFDKVVGISLGCACEIRFRERKNKKHQFKLKLMPGSLYLLSNNIRWHWEHSISPVKCARYSITLRTLRSIKDLP
ncbi:alpha-ketoglutarate-dependent dioxygenase AlkB [Legionella cardiaca]|uniref:Alpha-ketoglutarate-dependent dioxygenase AlkB n=1 Tax=Legionella cardiaca TaxID=1071983 RepID=A0ABY8AYR3_9GAMM|nr:alpha-ketoglutarate-dependent dioxygenase AlkB [Legionella cardiaca]WED44242.1 alpha-ketoglutarate-dependent dioxygenase AlkB [Legionella cardiaca]